MKIKNLLKISVVGLSALIFTACGGGDSDFPTQDISDKNPNGIRYGSQTINDVSYDAQYVVYNGEIYGYSLELNSMMAGTGKTNGENFSANYNLYDGDIYTSIGSGSISGEVSEEASISGSFHTSNGDEGTVSLSFNEQYNRDALFSTIAGDYGFIKIDDDGSIYQDRGDGCIISGSVSIPDSTVNIYNVLLDINGCGDVDTSLEGLGVVVDENGEEEFRLALANEYEMHIIRLKK